MNAIQQPDSERLREEPAEPSERLREEPAEPTERLPEGPAKQSQRDVLRYLEQSAILLEHVLNRTRHGGSGLPVDEQHALAQNLSIVSGVLRFLGERVVPSLLANGPAEGPLRQRAAWKVLTRLGRLTAELQLCWCVTPAAIN